MRQKTLQKLLLWELEEYLAFPILELLLFTAIYSIINQSILEISPVMSYSNLHWGIQNVFLFLIFVTSAILSRIFAGSYGKGETKVLLSYPVKRWQVFLSKFLAMFFTLCIIYGAIFSLHIYLHALNFFEPMFYISLLSIFLQILLMSTVVVVVSLLLKNEIVAILTSILLLYGIDNITTATSYLNSTGRFKIVFAYYGQLTHDILPTAMVNVPEIEEVILAFSIPTIISALLIFMSIFYFSKMEVD
ncbi:MAG: ABC transporter permease [Candidatus Bathyarchaeum tardum]|nr:MAG: ABC transporter permease [Candidatus Bathyarchaeum tardum]